MILKCHIKMMKFINMLVDPVVTLECHVRIFFKNQINLISK